MNDKPLTLQYLKSLIADPEVLDAVRNPKDPFSVAWHKREKEHKQALKQQKELLEKCEEVLKFYADDNNLKADLFDENGEPISCPFSRDKGKKAKQALHAIGIGKE